MELYKECVMALLAQGLSLGDPLRTAGGETDAVLLHLGGLCLLLQTPKCDWRLNWFVIYIRTNVIYIYICKNKLIGWVDFTNWLQVQTVDEWFDLLNSHYLPHCWWYCETSWVNAIRPVMSEMFFLLVVQNYHWCRIMFVWWMSTNDGSHASKILLPS